MSADRTPSRLDFAEHILTKALYADVAEREHLDRTLIEMAYTVLLTLAIEADRGCR